MEWTNISIQFYVKKKTVYKVMVGNITFCLLYCDTFYAKLGCFFN